jgi:hypothetical protein
MRPWSGASTSSRRFERSFDVRRELVAPGHDLRLAFRHLVIRDVAYETLTKEDRAVLHERVGDWIERTAARRLARRACDLCEELVTRVSSLSSE